MLLPSVGKEWVLDLVLKEQEPNGDVYALRDYYPQRDWPGLKKKKMFLL